MTTVVDWCFIAFGVGCCGWQCNRCLKFGSQDSKGWLEAGPEEVQDLLYYAQLNLAAYADSVERMDERTDRIVADNVLNFVGDEDDRRAPPYFIYINHEKKDIALMFRGLNMASKQDFWVLMRKKRQKYNHGYVHSGMFKAAQWVLQQEERILKRHCASHPDYTLSIVGHSLGAGIASLLLVLLHDDPSKVGIQPKDKNRIRAVCFAPPRVISRNHVVNYSHAIRAVVLQDDFFSRVDTSVVQHIFLGFTCIGLAGILVRACLADYFLTSGRRLKDPEKLFPPGKLYHIVYKEAWHCGKVNPRVVTDTPTGARFEKLILSLTATSDHHIKNYNKFLLQAMEGLGFREPTHTQLAAPVAQTLSRTESVDREGMAVEDEGKPSGKRGRLRPRKSYEITLQGTSSNVESYAEEIASIGSEEGEERTERTEGRYRIGGTERTERTGSTRSKQTEGSGQKEELERTERAERLERAERIEEAERIEGGDGTKGTELNGRKGDIERADGNGRKAETERTHRREPADGMPQAHLRNGTESTGQGWDSPPVGCAGGSNEKSDGSLRPKGRPSQERRGGSTLQEADGGKVMGEAGKRRGDEAQESGARELSEAADSAHPVESPGARQAPWSCSEESPDSKKERQAETKSAPFLKRFFFWGDGGAQACENSEQ